MQSFDSKPCLTLVYPDFVYDASMLAVAKVVGRRGDGKANMALWRLLLPDFYATGHVNSPEEIKIMSLI